MKTKQQLNDTDKKVTILIADEKISKLASPFEGKEKESGTHVLSAHAPTITVLSIKMSGKVSIHHVQVKRLLEIWKRIVSVLCIIM